jgi:hypothetical protein
MKGAVDEFASEDTRVRITFHPVEPVRLEDIGGGHLTACLLHTGQDTAVTDTALREG